MNQKFKNYDILEERELADLNSTAYRLKHSKTGANVVILSNDDENKVFNIGFRTPPTDSTGVAHILEHSVLCGSKNFPAKDPFVELVKGSLNTFLNAMTYPDKTLYPVASCNDKDFQNLMHVYLDAVFYPNIYQEENIFRQEGWHYHLEEKDGDLSITGVVYNEMKGAFSSPDDVLWREVTTSLFPDTTYSVESGGDPKNIPDLTYEQFLDFHGRYYHPSNSYIYLYGNMDVEEKLRFIDEEYLSSFEQITIDSAVPDQKSFEDTVEVVKTYPITDSEGEKDNTYLTYNMVVGDSLNKELYIALQILDYALCSAPGAPIKQALIDKGIGKDVYSICENGIKQPVFSVVAKGANEDQKEEFIQTIHAVLEAQVINKIDKKALLAGLNYYEFRYREADYGSYPKGLMYGLTMFDSWLYDETKPFLHVEAIDTYRNLKEKVATGYFEQLIEAYLLRNPHKSIVIVKPEKGLTTKNDKELQEKLNAYKATLSEDDIEQIMKKTEALLQYQEEESSQEALDSIPLLTREDIKKEAEGYHNNELKMENVTVLHHDLFTSGIGYLRILFDITDIKEELMPYLGILKTVLGYVDTSKHSYGDLYNEINIKTGGISTTMNTYLNSKNLDEYRFMFEIKGKSLYENLKDTFALMEEIMMESKLSDTKRLFEIIQEMKSRMQGDFMSAGHSLAAVRTLSYVSKTAFISESTGGLVLFRLLEELEEHFEEKKDDLVQKLQGLVESIFRVDNMMVDFTSDQKGLAHLEKYVGKLKKKLNPAKVRNELPVLTPVKKNEAFTNSAQVQYVCRGGNFITKGLEYTGALRALKVIMSYDYLWNNVRVKGGAYGCMCNFGKSGDSYFVSYRDPNLKKTIEIFEQAADFVKNFEADEKGMLKFIIGAVSDLDTPMNPAAKGTRSLMAYLTNQSFEDVQKERDELLLVNVEEIRKLAAYIQAFMEDDCLCVVGNEEKILEQKELFQVTENLFH